MAADRLVTARWLGGYQVDVIAGEFLTRVDEPERVGGTNTGPQPTDLFLALWRPASFCRWRTLQVKEI